MFIFDYFVLLIKEVAKMTETEFYELDSVTKQEVEDLKRKPIHKNFVIPTIEELQTLDLENKFDMYGRFLIFLSNYMDHYCPARQYDEEERATLKYIKQLIYQNIEI